MQKTTPPGGRGTEQGRTEASTAALYRDVAAGFLVRVDGIGGAWAGPSPCEGWTVRDVVAHTVVVHRRVLARLYGGEVPDIEPAPPQPGEDLPAELRTLIAAIQEAVDDPERAGQHVDSLIGRVALTGFSGPGLTENSGPTWRHAGVT